MVNTLVLCGRPLDKQSFDEHFTEHFRPMLREVPNVDQIVLNRLSGAAKGESPFYVVVDIQFSSEVAMQEGLNSEAGKSMAEDLAAFASGGATVLFSVATKEV